jgi:hypothetical protein
MIAEKTRQILPPQAKMRVCVDVFLSAETACNA